MGASHFFVGLGAGLAILTVPVLVLGGMDLPHRFASWIDGPSAHATQAGVAVVSRPAHGYKPGDPTPAADAPPTVEPALRPTPVPQVQPAFVQPLPSGGSMRTGVIRGGGAQVFVRHAAGVESPDDPQIADGAPVLVSAGGSLQIGGQPWRAVRGLSGIVGWVPSAQVMVDGEGPPLMVAASSAATPSAGIGKPSGSTPGAGIGNAGGSTSGAGIGNPSGPTSGAASGTTSGSVPVGRASVAGAATPTVLTAPGSTGGTDEHVRVANTDGAGVVLRNSPRDADKTTRGLMDGANVSVLERNGSDWVHVHADNGQDGWIPTRYVVPAV